MSNPLVTVIVLCYNHARFVEEAIISALNQSYENVELIAVDDSSTDESAEVVTRLSKKFDFKTILNTSNKGNCVSFNQALKESKGEFIIDLAADDLLLPSRVEKGVRVLESLGSSYGVHFCDADHITDEGNFIGTHYQRNRGGKLIESVPQDDVFRDVLERYFICTPTMMIRKKVLDELGGYDEQLSYEDFDFWVRSARIYKYSFSDEVLVKKRSVKNSLSRKQKLPGNRHVYSTALVCQKAFDLCQNQGEFQALKKRIQYELKWAALTGNFKSLSIFLRLLQRINREKLG